MDDTRAVEIIRMRDQERIKRSNWDNLYQQVADLMYPIENQIAGTKTPGEDKSLLIRDPTAVIALNKATSGFIAAWVPKDRPFFSIHVKNRDVANRDHVKRWCALAVEIAHEEMFGSNYMQQLQQTVKSTIGFGTGCLYSEWENKRLHLNYKSYHISTYTIKENSTGQADVVILDLPYTARQAAEEFGQNAGKKALEDAEKPATESTVHQYVRIDRPNNRFTRRFVGGNNRPFESLIVSVEEKSVVREQGYYEFPYAVPRWEKASCEKYGRGQGTMSLSAVKELQQMRKDFIEEANRHTRPPIEVVRNNIEGEVNLSPDAQNVVTERNAIGAIDGNRVLGNFPVTLEMIRFQQDHVKNDCFYNNIFNQFRELRGDRRVTLELELRNQEGLDELLTPVINMESELFTPHITRDILLLIRNGRIPQPPPELGGQPFGIEYTGKLAMSMKQYQARGFMQFAQVAAMLDPMFPDAKDTISAERALPDIALALGVKVSHLATPEEIADRRKRRAEDKMKLELAQAAQVASKGYKDTSKKAEEGSLAEMTMAGV